MYKISNPRFNDIYSFMRDRCRSVAQDFIIINLVDNV